MIHDFIEEDFRFSTRHQIDSYSDLDKVWKPHVPGLQLSQLQDLLATHMGRPDSCGRVFVQGPGGTVLCLLKHIKQYPAFRFARAFIDPKYCSETLLQTIGLLTNVSVTVSAEIDEAVFVRDRIDCWCITSGDRLQWCKQLECHPAALEDIDLLLFDPLSSLQDSHLAGKYYMNRQVWVCRLRRS